MGSCCDVKKEQKNTCSSKEKPETTNKTESSCCPSKAKKDILFNTCSIILLVSLFLYLISHFSPSGTELISNFNTEILKGFPHHIAELLGKMWWSLILSILFVGLISKIPSEFIFSILGSPGSKLSIVKAALAGVLLDLCNHGILLIGMNLYKKGASYSQTVAFLIASPWNSLSVTLILFSLIGVKWTLLFIILSVVLAISTGLICELLTKSGFLEPNPVTFQNNKDFKFFREAKKGIKEFNFDKKFFLHLPISGFKESRMILRWIFLGIILTGLMKSFFSADQINTWLGPTLAGLGMTLLLATVIEVCSEGGTPIAAEIFSTGKAPGNAFVFLMSGVSTDSTEILSLKSTTGTWKKAFALPLITVPKIILIGWFLNEFYKV
jgi:uncharacterized membrane protein YraQ (UPF0718 family)